MAAARTSDPAEIAGLAVEHARNLLQVDDAAFDRVADRYGVTFESGFGARLDPARATTWSGFEVATHPVERASEAAATGT